MPGKTIVYLSGPMTGRPDWNFPAFDAAAERLRSLGYRVVNPADFGAAERFTWADCVARDLAILPHVNLVCQLAGWESSRGAVIEAQVAASFGIPCAPLAELVAIGEALAGQPVDTGPAAPYCTPEQVACEGGTRCSADARSGPGPSVTGVICRASCGSTT